MKYPQEIPSVCKFHKFIIYQLVPVANEDLQVFPTKSGKILVATIGKLDNPTHIVPSRYVLRNGFTIIFWGWD